MTKIVMGDSRRSLARRILGHQGWKGVKGKGVKGKGENEGTSEVKKRKIMGNTE